MPELPEVETTRRGIIPHVLDQIVTRVDIRQFQLRWPIDKDLALKLQGQKIEAIQRRAKYLLCATANGTLIIHLGMSGSLRIVSPRISPDKHDHVDIVLNNGRCLRFRDPRRFGALLWTEYDALQHPLLKDLGPEPWDKNFNGDYLYRLSRQRQVPIKTFIMNGHIVVGVGNIYANEALFKARIYPKRKAGNISRVRYEKLVRDIQDVLTEAIAQGGTTLRDFVDSSGKPGYFAQQLAVYGRGGQPCQNCNGPIRESRIGQRSSFYCAQCQR